MYHTVWMSYSADWAVSVSSYSLKKKYEYFFPTGKLLSLTLIQNERNVNQNYTEIAFLTY